MDKLTRKVELFSNIAIILVAILLGTVLVRKYLLTQPTRQSNNAPANNPLNIGTKINLQDIDWSKNERTLVLALSNTCHFCSESAPFYKRLAQSKGDTRLIAVLSQSVEDGQRYMEKLGLSVNEVRQMPLANIGVEGTPTLLLVDKLGTVKNVWVGKLPPEQEIVVLDALQEKRSS